MPSTAEDIFPALFPEYAEVDSGSIDAALELAEADQADLWGDVRYQYAIACRAEHILESAGVGSTGTSNGTGRVTSEHIGSLSVSYASPSAGSGGGGTLDDTKGGRLLQELLAGAIVPAMTSGVACPCGCDCGWSTSTGFWHHGPWWP